MKKRSCVTQPLLIKLLYRYKKFDKCFNLANDIFGVTLQYNNIRTDGLPSNIIRSVEDLPFVNNSPNDLCSRNVITI